MWIMAIMSWLSSEPFYGVLGRRPFEGKEGKLGVFACRENPQASHEPCIHLETLLLLLHHAEGRLNPSPLDSPHLPAKLNNVSTRDARFERAMSGSEGLINTCRDA